MNTGRSRTPAKGLRRCAGALGLFLTLAGPGSAANALDVHEDLERVLRARDGDERTEEEVVDELAALGDGAIEVLFGLCAGDGGERLQATRPGEEGWWRRSPDRFGELARRALGRATPRRVVEYLERRCRADQDVLVRRSVLAVLEELGSARGLPLVLSLARELDGIQLRYRSIREPMIGALASMLARDPAAIDELPAHLRGASEDLLSVVVDALGRSSCTGATELLLDLLDRSEELDLAIVRWVGEISERAPWRVRADPRAVLGKLAAGGDWELRRAALVALARIGDPGAFHLLVESLSDASERVRRAAAWGLAELSGSETPRTEEQWQRWFDERRASWTADRDAFEEHLGDLEVGDAMDAVRRHGLRTLYRHDAALLLAQALEHEDPAVVQSACSVLRQLGSRHVVPALVEHLRSRNSAARLAAWQTLCALTGEELPAEPDAWETYLES